MNKKLKAAREKVNSPPGLHTEVELLRKAAVEARQLLSRLLDDDLILDLPGLRIEVTEIRENLLSALKW